MNEDRDISNFDKLASKTKAQLIATKEKSLEWLHMAVDASADQLEKAGEFTIEEGERARRFVKRDLAATRVDFVHARESVHKELNPSRVGHGFVELASHLFDNMSDLFQSWGAKSLGALAYNTGEVTGPGILTCIDCGTDIHLDRSSRIPPCAKCHQTAYRKSY